MLSGSRNLYFNLIFFSFLFSLIFLVLLLLGYLPSWLVSLTFLWFPYNFVFSWQVFFFNILIEFCIYCTKSLISRTFFMFPWTCLKSRILVFFFLLESIFLSSFLRIWINHFFPKHLLLLSLALLRFFVSVYFSLTIWDSLQPPVILGRLVRIVAVCSVREAFQVRASLKFGWTEIQTALWEGSRTICPCPPCLCCRCVSQGGRQSHLQGTNAAAMV